MITASILLLLATAFFVQKSDHKEVQQAMPLWSEVESSHVARINITVAASETIELQQTKNGWQLNGKNEADAEAVKRLLNDLSSMRPVRVVTRKHQHDKALRLDKKGIHVLLFNADGRKVFDAMVGKQGANLLSTYLRLRGSDVVLAVDQSLNWQLHRSLDDWKASHAKSEGVEQ